MVYFLFFTLLSFFSTFNLPVDACMGGAKPLPGPGPPIDVVDPVPDPAPVRKPGPVRPSPGTKPDILPPPGTPTEPLPEDFGPGSVTGRPDDTNKVPLKDVDTPDQLSCDFEKRRSCCWQTLVGPPGTPQFRKAVKTSKPYDIVSLQNAFGTTETPNGNFLYTQYVSGTSPTSVAEVRSCTVSCIKGTEFKLTLRHWMEAPSRLRVCLRDPFDAQAQYLDCDEAPLFSNPGPTTFELLAPEGEPFDVIIVADNLQESEGRLVAIDDITASFEPCTEVTPPPKKGSPLCPIECKFEVAFCRMKMVKEGSGTPPVTKEFERTDDEMYGNEDTGCPKPPIPGFYMGTKLEAHDLATFYVPKVKQQRGKDLSFMYYEATKDIHLEICKVDTKTKKEDCKDVSNRDVSLADREWLNARIPMDGKFDQIHFHAVSTGEHIGSVCVDSFLVVKSNAKPFGFEGPKAKKDYVCK